MDRFRISSIEPVVSSAQTLGAAFFDLAMVEGAITEDSRREVLATLEPAVEIIGQLFYVSEEELYRRDVDHVYLEMRIQRWYKDLVSIYPDGEAGLTRMAYKMTLVFDRLKSGSDVSAGEVDFLQTCLSLVHDAMDDLVGRYHEATAEFDSVITELEILANLNSGELSDEAVTEMADDSQDDQDTDLPLIFIYSQPCSDGEGREHYIFDPTSDEPNLIPEFTSQTQFLEALFEMASSHEGSSSLTIEAGRIIHWSDSPEAMGRFGLFIQQLIKKRMNEARIVYLPIEALYALADDDEEAEPDSDLDPEFN